MNFEQNAIVSELHQLISSLKQDIDPEKVLEYMQESNQGLEALTSTLLIPNKTLDTVRNEVGESITFKIQKGDAESKSYSKKRDRNVFEESYITIGEDPAPPESQPTTKTIHASSLTGGDEILKREKFALNQIRLPGLIQQYNTLGGVAMRRQNVDAEGKIPTKGRQFTNAFREFVNRS